MIMNSYVAFDLETTGLKVDTDEIIEVGAVKVLNGRLVEEFACIVNIHKKLPPFIKDLTGIDEQMLEDGYEKRPVVEEFLKFCEGYDVLGHNLMFDYKFMKTAAASLGYSFEKKGVDTLAVAKKALTDLEHKKLGNICKHYGYHNKYAHRAVHDAKATAYIYEQMRNEFAAEYEELFRPKPLNFKIKKQESMTISQKRYLLDLLKYHKIESNESIINLSKSEASKLIDSIILKYGMIRR